MKSRRSLSPLLMAPGLSLLGAFLAVGCSQVTPPVAESVRLRPDKIPVIFVPGVTGVGLRDLDRDRLHWGNGSSLLRPHDRGYQTARSITEQHPGPHLVPDAVIMNLRLFGIVRYAIYQQLVDLFSANDFRVSDLTNPHPEGDFFLFSYDWRQDNVASAQRLAAQLERLRVARGEETLEVDLICQSNGAHICRYFSQFGALNLDEAESGRPRSSTDLQVQKLILVGSSNGGSIRVLRELNRGRTYINLIGRTWSPETLFTYVSLYQDLPVYTRDLFVDERGEAMDVDLWKVESWQRFQWSIWGPQASRRLSARELPPWFGTAAEREDYLAAALDRAARFHQVLHSDSADPGSTRYYLLSNMERDTAARAVLVERSGLWETWFEGDKMVRQNPTLQRAVVVAGDGHATKESLKWLSPQELRRLGENIFEAEGTHRRLILEPSVHRQLLQILASAPGAQD